MWTVLEIYDLLKRNAKRIMAHEESYERLDVIADILEETGAMEDESISEIRTASASRSAGVILSGSNRGNDYEMLSKRIQYIATKGF